MFGETVADSEIRTVGASAVTSVPNGTVTEIVFAPSLIMPVAAGEVKENAVIALEADNAEADCCDEMPRSAVTNNRNVERLAVARFLAFI